MYRGSVNITADSTTTKSISLKDFAKEFLMDSRGVAEYIDKGISKFGENEFWLADGGCCMDYDLNAFILKGSSIYRVQFITSSSLLLKKKSILSTKSSPPSNS